MDNLVQFEEDFNSRTEKLRVVLVARGWLSQTRPDQFLDHLTVMTNYTAAIRDSGDHFHLCLLFIQLD